MYDHMLARSFSRNEQKRFGNCALVICFTVTLSLCVVFRPSFHLSILDLEVSTSSGLDVLILSASQDDQPLGVEKLKSTISEPLSTMPLEQGRNENETRTNISKPFVRSSNQAEAAISTNDKNVTSQGSPLQESRVLDRSSDSGKEEISDAICSFSELLSDHCEIKGNVRIDGNSSTIFLVSSNTSNIEGNGTYIIRPYARKTSVAAMNHVPEWTIKTVEGGGSIPSCAKKHNDPAILFSTSGYSGNHFHDFSDIVVPLFANTRIFNGKVHLLATNYQRWWISKFRGILNKLSDYEVMDVDREAGVQCYQNAIIGLKSHKELGIDASRSPNGYSMKDFRNFLRSTYSLPRKTAIKLRKGDSQKPRVMIISRRRTRRLTNEAEIIKMAETIGYEVVLAEGSLSTNLSKFAQIVNSCDVFMGVHGAGLTNMVFLPDKAVVVQVVPLGGIDWFAKIDFGEPSKDMKLRYLSYSIRVSESSLITQYPLDHAVFRDPKSIHKQGWEVLSATYLEKQNVKLDVGRFRSTLLKALKLLHH